MRDNLCSHMSTNTRGQSPNVIVMMDCKDCLCLSNSTVLFVANTHGYYWTKKLSSLKTDNIVELVKMLSFSGREHPERADEP